MPVIIIGADEKLTYTPDREGFANFPPELREAIAAWQTDHDLKAMALQHFLAQCRQQGLPIPDELMTPLDVPPLLLDAIGRMATFDMQDVVYTYKRLPGNVRAAIFHRHTSLGITDNHSARYDIGAAALTGWLNVCDASGSQIPFDRALIPCLPGAHVLQIGLLNDVGAPTDFLGSWLGSLNGNSSSKGMTATAAEHA